MKYTYIVLIVFIIVFYPTSAVSDNEKSTTPDDSMEVKYEILKVHTDFLSSKLDTLKTSIENNLTMELNENYEKIKSYSILIIVLNVIIIAFIIIIFFIVLSKIKEIIESMENIQKNNIDKKKPRELTVSIKNIDQSFTESFVNIWEKIKLDIQDFLSERHKQNTKYDFNNKTTVDTMSLGNTLPSEQFPVKTDDDLRTLRKASYLDYFYIERKENKYYLNINNKILQEKPDLGFNTIFGKYFKLKKNPLGSSDYYHLKSPATIEWDPNTDTGRVVNKGLLWI